MDIHKAIARAARSPRLEQAMLAARSELFAPVDLAQLEQRELQVHTPTAGSCWPSAPRIPSRPRNRCEATSSSYAISPTVPSEYGDHSSDFLSLSSQPGTFHPK